MNPSDMITDINSVINEIGQGVTVFQVMGGSVNKYGDFAFSGSNLYVSGVSATAYFVNRNSSEQLIRDFSNVLVGNTIGYFKSGVGIDVDYRVSGASLGDFKVNAFNDFVVSGVLVYKQVLLDTI